MLEVAYLAPYTDNTYIVRTSTWPYLALYLNITGPSTSATISPLSQTVEVGQPAVIKCIARGHPVARFSWFGPDGQVLPNYDSYVKILPGGGLLIIAVQFQHRGLYTCRVNSPYGQLSEHAQLDVSPAPECGVDAPKAIIAPANSTIYLNTTEIFEATLCANYSSLVNRKIFEKVAKHAIGYYKYEQSLAERLNAILVLDILNVISASSLFSKKVLSSLERLQQVRNDTNLVTDDFGIDVSALVNTTDLPSQSAVNRSAAIANAIRILNATHRSGVFYPAPDFCTSFVNILNNSVYLTCEAVAEKFVFYHNGVPINGDTAHFKIWKRALLVHNIIPSLAGNYTCVAVKGCASQSATAIINVTSEFSCSCYYYYYILICMFNV